MPHETAIKALSALGQPTHTPVSELGGSMSQSSVYLVRLNGHNAVLKAAGADDEQDLARHELAFYRTLADQVPVRTPDLLDYVDTDDLTAILLTAHNPAPSAREWDNNAWIDVARHLATLHDFSAAPDTSPWDVKPWVQDMIDHPPVNEAKNYWSHTPAGPRINHVLDSTNALVAALAAFPHCFIHGDCHAGNLLTERGELVWVDWAVTGHGAPAIDLGSLCGRAQADGADLPYDAMLREYTASRGIDHDDFRRSMLAAELATLLFGWPEYAHLHTRNEQRGTIQRLVQRLDDWQKLTA